MKLKPESGFHKKGRQFVFRSNVRQKEINLHFNAASSGYVPKAAHGHTDALSIAINIGESPFLVDPAAVTYQSDPGRRRHFATMFSHNTIKINQKVQSEITRPATWLNRYKSNILETKFDELTIQVKAEHDGYKNLGVKHTRELIFEKSKNLIWINDTVECFKSGQFFVELPFLFHPNTSVKQNNPINFQASDENGHVLYMVVDKKFTTKLIRGLIISQMSNSSANAKEIKEPCTTVYCTAPIEHTTTFQTIILVK
ncbi:heparinase II/III family protein [Mariniphaga anaerophila]|nr:heparinase II/III-family protein [Mariniphaga anaerophila]